MEYTGYVPKEQLPIKPGDKVHIPKGAIVQSTNPRRVKEPSKRSQVITVHHILSGYRDEYPPKVCWAGSGGYWSEVSINDVEILTG
jgi:hypothetical protein